MTAQSTWLVALAGLAGFAGVVGLANLSHQQKPAGKETADPQNDAPDEDTYFG